ncbi:MAG TPA: DUF4358 domain-containing protein [Candidatus Blautia pullistercoris]|uniref:DUF4358 domain-containing protein n=1 Tax=Candidatus Blautia pullistercoris TaxID=2838499 RepID=A0A9D2APF1_9FIRM|nr:DUF4358 domain-containing protein [Clostridiales bacterium]HIX38900.1 DUF4358 domain-containing protein [Candidatus Blautia pullistercoris]
MNKQNISILTILRITMVAALLIFMIVLQVGNRSSNASLESVSQEVLGAADQEGMQESNNRMFQKFYGLDAQDYEGVTLYSPVSNMDAQELLIVKLKDSSQAEAVTEAINSRLETQMNSFEGYGIEQYAMLEDHILDVQGNFILYVVNPNAQAADDAFRNSL